MSITEAMAFCLLLGDLWKKPTFLKKYNSEKKSVIDLTYCH